MCGEKNEAVRALSRQMIKLKKKPTVVHSGWRKWEHLTPAPYQKVSLAIVLEGSGYKF